MWKLHAVLIKKDLSPEQAKEQAEKIVKHAKEHIIKMRKTDNMYRFDVMDKTLFNKFRTKKVNENIDLVFGVLKQQQKTNKNDDSGTESNSDHYTDTESEQQEENSSDSDDEEEKPNKHFIHNYKLIKNK